MIEELEKFWNSKFKGFVPEAHKLKIKYKERWVRFHALPESKRYPENEEEYSEIFRRHNIVLQELCGKNKVLVVLPEYSEKKKSGKPEPSELFPLTEPWYSFKPYDDEVYWHLHVSEVEFTGSELNNLFRLVANNEIGNIMVICPDKHVIFHPYDGGSDVVLASTEQRDYLKEKYHEWLSSHPEGF